MSTRNSFGEGSSPVIHGNTVTPAVIEHNGVNQVIVPATGALS